MLVAGRLLTAEGDAAALPLLVWLHRDLLIERLEVAVDAAADDANALTVEQRTEQLAEIDHDRLAVERDEEHWITEAIAGGATVLRRPGHDPRAVLALGSDMPPP